MGIIIKQSAKNMIATYLGFGVGAINTLFLYTNFLEPEYYGLVTFLLSAASLIWPLMAFGVHNTLVKFYSSYAHKQQQDQLLNLVLLMPLVIALVLGTLGVVSYQLILDYFSSGNELVKEYVGLIYIIAVGSAYFEVFFSWAKVHYKSVFGNFMKEVFHRICVTFMLLSVFFEWISVEQFIYWVSGVYILRALLMMIYAFTLRSPKFQFNFPENSAQVLKYSGLILIAGSVAMILLDLDKVMIEHYLPIENVAIYSIAIYIASVVGVPAKAMHQITYPLTAILLNQGDKEGLNDLYKKSSISLLLISGLIFILIVANLQPIYALIPEEYNLPFVIVILISAVKLYDSMMGNNNSILFNSDYYRLVLWIGVMLAACAFVFNLIFIPLLGIVGAAIATFLAFVLYNSIKLLIVYQKFQIQPFNKNSLYGLLCIAAFSIGFSLWEFSFHPFLNILLKSGLIVLFYLPLVHYLKLSEDISGVVLRVWEIVKSKTGH